MDLTKTMKDEKDTLTKAANDISRKIKELTDDYQIGFGSFSDKPTIPFSKEKSVYEKEGKLVPYAFKHHMSLTKNIRGTVSNKNIHLPVFEIP